ncbi:penicillin-binding protein activator [Thalassotalea euphylliae]|uniref:penicillin-binding protein activator n=1 Tax=Thalassotalea euphylliae TaxID=1655234 RepID=UPI00362E6E02
MPERTDFSLVIPQSLHRMKRISACLACSTFILFGCATPQKTVEQQPTIVEPEPIVETGKDAQSYIEDTKNQPAEQATLSLLTASELLLSEQDAEKALWLANQVDALLTNSQDKYRAKLVKAQALLALDEISLALEQLEHADELGVTHHFNYYATMAQVQQARGFDLEVLAASLQAFPLNPSANELDIDGIWQQFKQLNSWQLSDISKQSLPYVKGWVQLTRYANQFGAEQEQFNRYLSQWQRQYPTHPANAVILPLQQELIEAPINYDKIAVILPLSGKQQAAGMAAQQGILAAYANNASAVIKFHDSTTLDWQALDLQFEQDETDFVIGPLLRANVEQYLANVTTEMPTLLLNLPQPNELAPYQYAISMRPEDEAIQAAASLAKKDYKMPIVLVHNDSVSQRIAKAFTSEWHRATGYSPTNLPFERGKTLQTTLKSALGVHQSQSRIKEIDRRIKFNLKADPRNRRDIDMIYIVGSPTQTRLLKPYIDVNISPFADAIPMYASSRSHSARHDGSDTRDLAGLSFTEMPWLLDSKQQNKGLAEQSKALFPQRSDSLQRIFAMGFDALNLVNKLNAMQNRPFVKHFGQTGTLTLNNNQILTRSLLWGRYDKDKVTEIAMD